MIILLTTTRVVYSSAFLLSIGDLVMGEVNLLLHISAIVDNLDVDESELNELEQAVYASLNNSKTYSDFQRNIGNIVSSARSVFESFGASLPKAVNIEKLITTMQDALKGFKLKSGDILDDDVINALTNKIKKVYDSVLSSVTTLETKIESINSQSEKIADNAYKQLDALDAEINKLKEKEAIEGSLDSTSKEKLSQLEAEQNAIVETTAVRLAELDVIKAKIEAERESAKYASDSEKITAKKEELMYTVMNTDALNSQKKAEKELVDSKAKLAAINKSDNAVALSQEATARKELQLEQDKLKIGEDAAAYQKTQITLGEQRTRQIEAQNSAEAVAITKEKERTKQLETLNKGTLDVTREREAVLKNEGKEIDSNKAKYVAAEKTKQEASKKATAEIRNQTSIETNASRERIAEINRQKAAEANASRESIQSSKAELKNRQLTIQEGRLALAQRRDEARLAKQVKQEELSKAITLGKIIGSLRTLQTAFRSLNQAIEKNIKLAANVVKVYVSSFGKIATAVTKVAVTMSGLPTMLKGIASAASSIKSTLVSAFSGISITDLLKQSSELQSQLKEVQNVVNVVFGKDGKQVIKDFASTAVRNLGMSTLAAEQFAGKFGAALTTTGQSRESVIQMSKALTTLTGDLASFYDIEQDVAASKLFSGVISGQIKPMRELGVDMTKASLAAYAAAEGYEKEYKDMSAAEKQAVRFHYVMDKLNFVHGDYLRTINSTANQLRLLKNQLKELGTVIGAIINAFINPLIHAFNNVILVVTEAAKRLAAIMGIKLDFGSRGAGLIELGDDFDETADSADDMADAEDGATDSLHKLSKAAKGALSPLHKLNVLQNKQSKDTSNSDAASGISNLLDGLEDDVASDLPSIQDMIKNFLDWLWNLDWEGGLAKIIDKLNEWFKKLPDMIQDFFDKLQPWIERLAGLFNQLFRDLDWEGFGRTVSEVVEGIGRSLGTFLETLSTYDAGEALGKFINGLIKNQDMFTEWGKTMGLAIQRGFEFILGAVRTIEWDTLGTSLFAGLKEAFKQIDPETIKDTIFEALAGVTKTINTFFTEFENDEKTRTKIKDSFLAVLNGGVEYLKNGGYDELVDNIAKFISDAFNSLSEWLDTDENKEAIGGAIDKTIEGVGEVLQSGAKLAASIKGYLARALQDFFLKDNGIPFEVKLLVAVKAADLTGITDLAKFIVEGLIAAKLLGILGVVGELGLAVGAIVAEYKILDTLLYKITGEHSSWTGAVQSMGNFIQIIYSLLAGISVLLIHGIADVIDTIGDMLQEFPGIGASIQQTFDAAADKLRTVASEVAQGNQEVANSIYGWTHSYSAVDDKVKETSGVVSQATDEEAAMYEKMADSVVGSYDKIGTKSNETATSVTDNLKGAKDTVTTDWDSESGRMGYFQSLVDGSNDVYKQLDENTKNTVSTIDNDLSSIGTSADFSSTASNYNEQLLVPLTENTQTATQQITESIQNIATALGEETFAAVAEQFLTGVVEPIKTGVEELAIAIEQGFTTAKNNTQTVWESFSGWWTIEVTQKITDNITQSIESIETLNTTAYDSITQIWAALPEFIETDIAQKIEESLSGIFEKSETDTEKSVDVMKDAWTSLAEHIQSVLDDISSSLDDMVSKAQEAASAIADAASSSSYSSSSYNRGYPSSVQGYANGGVFRPNTPQLAILGDNKSQTEYALTTGHLREIASMMASAIDTSGVSGVESITVPIYLGTELIDQEIINVGNMHNYRSNGR